MEKQNIAVIINGQIQKYGERAALKYKEDGAWREISWREMGRQVNAVARALIKLGLAEKQAVAIFAANSPWWTIADLGILNARCMVAPIHAPSTMGQAKYIVDDADARLIFVGGQEQYAKVMKFFGQTEGLQTIVCFDRHVRLEQNPNIMYFDDFLALGQAAQDAGAEVETRLGRARADDLVTLIYTSGTTGEPKGVMLDHANFYHQYISLPERFAMFDSDRSLCLLPLSHVFERAWTYNALARGMTNHYCADPKQALEYMQEVKPHFVCMVPRFYEKIYSAVFNKLESAPENKRKLFHWALQTGLAAGRLRIDNKPLPLGLKLRHALADALVLKKIRQLTGGEIRVFPCAGAPLSPEIDEFFWAVGIFVCLGFGMTETTATVTCPSADHKRFGTCGTAIKDTELKLAPDGELLVRGPQVMRGYYNKPEETAKTLVDGWLYTGDVAAIDQDGFMSITDRKKDLMKTSGGKYIAPQPVENAVGKDHFVEQILLVADGRKFASALIVPCFESLEQWAQANGVSFASRQELVDNPRVVEFYAQRVKELTKDLEKHEKIQKFILLPEEFTIEEGEMTPTLKLKRKVILAKYADRIEAMYKE